MSVNLGGGTRRERGTTQIVLPQPDAQEKELRQLNLELSRIQAAEYLQGLKEQEEYRNSPLAATQKAIEERASSNILARLTGQAPVLSPDEENRLDTIFGNTQRRGEQDLTRYAQELASARGMSVTDSPIGNEALRQQQEFTTNLGAQRAAASFDLGNAETLFNQAQQQFANQLRQQAYMNRLSFASQAPASFGMQQGLFAERLGQAGRNFSGNTSGFQWGAGASGSDMQGYGAGLKSLGFV